jgi:hypothetical protein
MPSDPEPPKPLDQLIDLLIYAPVGLLYEHQEVLPKLIKRGRSQVQLARVLGQMAVSKGQTSVEDSVSDAVGVAATVLSRAVTELASAIGLVGDSKSRPAPGGAGRPGAAVEAGAGTTPPAAARPPAASADLEPAGGGADGPLPIAGYDQLKAREIIPLLDELSGTQRQRIREHELATRQRKTILGKLDRLEA